MPTIVKQDGPANLRSETVHELDFVFVVHPTHDERLMGATLPPEIRIVKNVS